MDQKDIEKPCSECCDKLYEFVRWIATDYYELSHEKVRIQRDDYIRKAKELLKELEDGL